MSGSSGPWRRKLLEAQHSESSTGHVCHSDTQITTNKKHSHMTRQKPCTETIPQYDNKDEAAAILVIYFLKNEQSCIMSYTYVLCHILTYCVLCIIIVLIYLPKLLLFCSLSVVNQ